MKEEEKGDIKQGGERERDKGGKDSSIARELKAYTSKTLCTRNLNASLPLSARFKCVLQTSILK